MPSAARATARSLTERSLLVAATLLAVACTPPPVDLRPVTTVQGDYDDVLDRWTRSTESYDGFKSSLFVEATLFGPEMSEAWLREQARLFHQDEPTVAASRASLTQDTALTYRFFVALFTNETRWNDLDRPDPAFRMWLGTDLGPRVAPASIERVRDRNETVRALFPYLGPFRQGYIVRFPRVAGGGVQSIPEGATHVTLELTGPHGSATLEWELAR